MNLNALFEYSWYLTERIQIQLCNFNYVSKITNIIADVKIKSYH